MFSAIGILIGPVSLQGVDRGGACPNLKLQLLVSTPLLIWQQKNGILYPIL